MCYGLNDLQKKINNPQASSRCQVIFPSAPPHRKPYPQVRREIQEARWELATKGTKATKGVTGVSPFKGWHRVLAPDGRVLIEG